MARKARASRLRSLDECNEALRQIGLIEIKLEQWKGKTDAKILEAKRIGSAMTGPLVEELDRLAGELEAYYREHRDEIEQGKRKSIELAAGRIGCRRKPPALKTVGRLTWAGVVERVRNLLGERFIHVEEAVDKDAVKGAAFDAERLREAGLRISQPEEWWYEVDRTKLDRR